MTLIRKAFQPAFRRAFKGAFDLPYADADGDPILALFANGEQGAYAYPTDQRAPDGDYMSFTDLGGTTPATSHNDPVGYIRDISGNGNDFVAPNAASRPLLVLESGLWRWRFDGIDDYLETGALSSKIFTPATGLFSVGVSTSASGIGGVFEESATSEATVEDRIARVAIYSDDRASPIRISAYAPDGTARYIDRLSQWDGSAEVITSHISGANFAGRLDGVEIDTTAHNSAVFPAGTTSLNIGKQTAGPLYFEGDAYGFVARDDTGDIAVIESRIAELAGVTL